MSGAGRVRRCVAAALILAVAACTGGGGDDVAAPDAPSSTSPGAGWDGELRLGLVGVRTLDPALVSPAVVSEMMLADLVYDTLTVVDDGGRVHPGLATATANRSRTVWRFELRPGVTFADGTPIVATDVVFSLDRIRAEGATSLAAISLDGVRSVTAIGVGAVDVELEKPSAVLPEVLSSPAFGIVSKAATEGNRGAGTPVASGDYSAAVTATDQLVLTRRAGTGPESIRVRLFETDETAYDSFLAGELDWAPVPISRFGEAIDQVGEDGLVPFAGTVMLGVNARVAPLDTATLRQAIAYAIDRSTLAAAVFGPAAFPLPGLVPTGVPGAAEQCVQPCGPNAAAARELVSGTFSDGQDVPLRLLTDRSDTQQAIAGVLRDQLAAAGISLQVSALDAPTTDELVASGQQQLFLFSSLGVGRTPATLLAPQFASGSPDNLLRYSNEVVDAAIEAAVGDPVPATRAAAWRSVEATVLADVPVVPLVQLRTVAAVSPHITGFEVRVDGSVDVSAVRSTT